MFGQKKLQNSNLNRGLIECFVLCCFVLYFKTLFEVYSSLHVHTVHRMEHSALQQYLDTVKSGQLNVSAVIYSFIAYRYQKQINR